MEAAAGAERVDLLVASVVHLSDPISRLKHNTTILIMGSSDSLIKRKKLTVRVGEWLPSAWRFVQSLLFKALFGVIL